MDVLLILFLLLFGRSRKFVPTIAIMSSNEEVFLTSRSRAPSIIDVKTENDHVFAQLPDIIQEAAISTECKIK
jgi:hypothetical protein